MAEQQLFLQNCNGLYCRLISFKHSEEVMGKEIGVRLTETEEKQLRLSCVLFFCRDFKQSNTTWENKFHIKHAQIMLSMNFPLWQSKTRGWRLNQFKTHKTHKKEDTVKIQSKHWCMSSEPFDEHGYNLFPINFTSMRAMCEPSGNIWSIDNQKYTNWTALY